MAKDNNEETKDQAAPKKETYIGTKVIKASPLSKHDFDRMKDGRLPADTDEDQEGYLVEYEDGYKSWSPKVVFERCYRKVTEQEKKMM